MLFSKIFNLKKFKKKVGVDQVIEVHLKDHSLENLLLLLIYFKNEIL